MEGLIKKTKTQEIKQSREGEESLVFLERMSNPQIRQKLINFILECDKDEKNKRFILEDSGEKLEVFVPTREELEVRYDSVLAKIKENTSIVFEGPKVQPNHESLNLDFILPENGEKPTLRQWSIIEAHEKGHELRFFDLFAWGEAEKIFTESFDVDFENGQFDKKELERFNNIYNKKYSFKFASKNVADYLFTPMEIIERMSQIKNYFGMFGDEVFTKEHLSYAKENYVKDTGFDNWMTLFFKSIKPNKEDKFVEIMNTVGI
jgi:hypothetical protein